MKTFQKFEGICLSLIELYRRTSSQLKCSDLNCGSETGSGCNSQQRQNLSFCVKITREELCESSGGEPEKIVISSVETLVFVEYFPVWPQFIRHYDLLCVIITMFTSLLILSELLLRTEEKDKKRQQAAGDWKSPVFTPADCQPVTGGRELQVAETDQQTQHSHSLSQH